MPKFTAWTRYLILLLKKHIYMTSTTLATSDRSKLIDTLKSWFFVLFGTAVMASGFVFFINPYNIVPGGVYGASIVMHNIFPSIQVGTFGYFFDVPLLILSVVLLGSKLGMRTIVSALFLPLVMNAMSWLAYPTQEALEQLDPTQLCGGIINLSDHLFLTTIIGSTIIGIGCGIVVRNNATTGGSDIVAMILQKYLQIKFSVGILIVDSVVVTFGLIVIGFGIGSNIETPEAAGPSCLLSFYSLIAIYVASRVIAFTINGSKNDKLMFVISNGSLDRLKDYIINDLDRSGTYIKSKGLYTQEDKEMIMLVVSYRQTNLLKAKIKEVDPRAFVIVTDAYDAYGEGWKPLPLANELEPE